MVQSQKKTFNKQWNGIRYIQTEYPRKQPWTNQLLSR